MTMQGARVHHYFFVHRFLPGLVDRAGSEVIQKLKENGTAMLADMWNAIGEDMEDEPQVPSDGISLEPISIEGFDAVAITFPEPLCSPEAYFALICSKKKRFSLFGKAKARYFTLELGERLEGGKRTVLCEWSGERHSNFGDGPEPQLAEFVAAAMKIAGH